jgi:glucose/arabinose dehydrogenase
MNSIRTTTVALLFAACANGNATPSAAELECAAPERIASLPASIREASGIAPVRGAPGHYWVHNDSEGEPALYALDRRGAIAARISMPSVEQFDWEDIATAPCAGGNCVYIADIGDNLHRRSDIAILRFPEPALHDGTVATVDRFPVRYPDGAHDAEAIFVLPDGQLFIVTKGRDTAAAVYRYPGALRSETVTLERVQQLTPGIVQLPDMVTGAAASPDGATVAIRTYSGFRLYRPAGDSLVAIGSAALAPGTEPQGEGVSVGDNGEIVLVSEAGPMNGAAPLTRVQCRVPRGPAP